MSISKAAVASLVVILPMMSRAQSQGRSDDPAVAIMKFYPAVARAAGVEGKASLICKVSEHARVSDCEVTFEAPDGYGFGDAAIALSKLSQDNPNVSITPPPKGEVITFTFRLKPPSISPNTLEPAHLDRTPEFLARPDPKAVARAYPPAAASAHIAGRVVLDCIVTQEGRLSPCTVLDEQPSGWGFGKGAIKMASDFKMKPGSHDGVPVVGGHYRLPISFNPR
jgi:TonB family protein